VAIYFFETAILSLWDFETAKLSGETNNIIFKMAILSSWDFETANLF
jgi:hypothetical protein